MKASGIHSDFIFTGNPVIISDVQASASGRAELGITLDDETVMSAVCAPGADINVADVIDSVTPYLPEPQSDEYFICLETKAEMEKKRRVSVSSGDNEEESWSAMAFPGGVSTANLRYLKNAGTDIFACRLLKYNCNFFLTTRTNHWMLRVRERELTPLSFIINEPIRMVVRDALSAHQLTFKTFTEGVWALNLGAIRRDKLLNGKSIPSVIDIEMGGVFACRVVIEDSYVSSSQSYRIKFRNSLGVFEVIELFGPMTTKSSAASENTVGGYSVYNPELDSFELRSSTEELTQTFTLFTGPRSSQEMMHILDMLNSPEMYLLDYDGEPVRVIAKSKEAQFTMGGLAPQSIEVNFMMADSNQYHTPELATALSRRIFASQFGRQFN